MKLLLLILGALPLAAAAEVYKCKSADGSSTYQDVPCDGSAAEKAHEVKVTPPSSPSPDQKNVPSPWKQSINARGDGGVNAAGYLDAMANMRDNRRTNSPPVQVANEPTAVRCTDVDGNVTYAKRKTCPLGRRHERFKEIRDETTRHTTPLGYRIETYYVYDPVITEVVSQKEACREIRSGRAKSNLSSYEKNTGRDPCG